MRQVNLGHNENGNDKRRNLFDPLYKYYTWSDMERKFASYGITLPTPDDYRLKFWNSLGDGKKYFVFEPYKFHSIKIHETGAIC